MSSTPPDIKTTTPYSILKELDSTYIMAHQHEAPTATTELLTQFICFTIPGLEPATLWSIAA